jgi:hypothetical protein
VKRAADCVQALAGAIRGDGPEQALISMFVPDVKGIRR